MTDTKINLQFLFTQTLFWLSIQIFKLKKNFNHCKEETICLKAFNKIMSFWVITKRFFYGRQFYNFAGGMNSATQQRPRVLTRELLFCVLFFWGWVVKRGRDQSGRNIKVKKRGPKIDLLLEYETFCQFCSFFDCDGSSKLERWERRGEGKQN